MRLELTRPNGHYPLKVARLPIPPLLHNYAKQQECAQNRTRTCTSLNTRTWNERVYHSATWAYTLERKTRLELATPTLARLCSTNWAISAFLRNLAFSAVLIARKFRINTQCFVLQTKNSKFQRAENEARTRDPNLGKVVLYQLSYFRILRIISSVLHPCQGWNLILFRQGCALPTELFPHLLFRLTGAKVVLIFRFAKLFRFFYIKNKEKSKL